MIAKASFLPLLICGIVLSGISSCARVKVEPIEVKPIEINVNVHVKVERELDNFFGDLDAREQVITR